MYPCTKYKLYLHRLRVLATYFGKFNLINGSNKKNQLHSIISRSTLPAWYLLSSSKQVYIYLSRHKLVL